jgi:hypothetical protein
MLNAKVNRLLVLLRMVLLVTLVSDRLTLKANWAMNHSPKLCDHASGVWGDRVGLAGLSGHHPRQHGSTRRGSAGKARCRKVSAHNAPTGPLAGTPRPELPGRRHGRPGCQLQDR